MATISIILTYMAGLFGPCYVVANPIIYERPPQAVVERMRTFGSSLVYDYMLMPDGRLYVDQGQGWKRLRY